MSLTVGPGNQHLMLRALKSRIIDVVRDKGASRR